MHSLNLQAEDSANSSGRRLGCGTGIETLTSWRYLHASRIRHESNKNSFNKGIRQSLPCVAWRKNSRLDQFRLSKKKGDCIYDFSAEEKPKLRRSIHKEENRETDLSGKNVLLSNHFYYFGDKPIALRPDLRAIIHSTQGHKSHANEPYVADFVNWIEGGGWKKNEVLSQPQLKQKIISESEEDCRSSCSQLHREEDEGDENC